MNKTDKIKKKLQIVMYVLIILSILRSFIARASAESMPEYVQDYLYDDMDVHFTNWRNYQSSINTVVSECPYFVRYNLTIGSSNYVFYDFFKYEHLGINSVFINNYFYAEGMSESGSGYIMTKSNENILPSTGVTAYRFVIYDSSILYYIMSYNCTSSTPTIVTWCNTGYFYTGDNSYYLRPINASISSSSFSVNTSSYVGYGNLYINNAGNNFVSSSTTVPDPVDNRFHARTFKNSYNQNMIEIKWDSNVYPNTGSFTYLKSVLQLTIMVNGNQSSVTFDSDNYPDLFVTPNTSYIPYMFLDSVGNVVTLQDSDSAFLTKIQLTQYAYPSSASSSSATAYTASTVYNLSLTDSVQLPIWSDPTISQLGGHIIDIATGNVYDNVSFSPPDGYSQQHISDLESVPWADVKVISQVAVTGNSQSTIDNLYKDISYLLMRDWKYFADSSLTDFNDIAAYIQSDNQYTDTYDIIIFLWNDNGSDLCWVTYTHRYYIRLMYKQFGNFQTIMEGSASYVADIYDYLFSRLEPLNDNLILYFDSVLSNNQTILSYVQSINGFCNSIDNTLFSGFNSVIGSGGRSLTDIYNRLGDISVGASGGFILNDFMIAFENKMSYLFVPTYDGLEDNFDTAIDDLGILALPFSFSYELISACKVPYSYTLDITFPSMSIPWHEELDGGSVDSNLVLWDDYDISFNPATVIPPDWLEFFQYLNALLVLVSVTLLTYRHIFRHSEGQGGSTL